MRNSPPVIRKPSARPDLEASLEAGNKKESEIDEEWLQVDVNVKEKRDDGVLRIVLISDTHNRHRMLDMPEGDILIHAGDFTNNGTEQEIKDFDSWLAGSDYKHKIVVPGNHDTGTDEKALRRNNDNVEVTDVANAIVLRGEMGEVMGLRVFGFPDTIDLGCAWWAYGANSEEELKERAAGGIPSSGVDILVSHSPPWMIGDVSRSGKHCGSPGLREVVLNQLPPKLWAFGHVHECGGRAYRAEGAETLMVNAASFLRSAEGLRPAMVVDICKETKALLGTRAAPGQLGATC